MSRERRKYLPAFWRWELHLAHFDDLSSLHSAGTQCFHQSRGVLRRGFLHNSNDKMQNSTTMMRLAFFCFVSHSIFDGQRVVWLIYATYLTREALWEATWKIMPAIDDDKSLTRIRNVTALLNNFYSPYGKQELTTTSVFSPRLPSGTAQKCSTSARCK